MGVKPILGFHHWSPHLQTCHSSSLTHFAISNFSFGSTACLLLFLLWVGMLLPPGKHLTSKSEVSSGPSLRSHKPCDLPSKLPYTGSGHLGNWLPSWTGSHAEAEVHQPHQWGDAGASRGQVTMRTQVFICSNKRIRKTSHSKEWNRKDS